LGGGIIFVPAFAVIHYILVSLFGQKKLLF